MRRPTGLLLCFLWTICHGFVQDLTNSGIESVPLRRRDCSSGDECCVRITWAYFQQLSLEFWDVGSLGQVPVESYCRSPLEYRTIGTAYWRGLMVRIVAEQVCKFKCRDLSDIDLQYKKLLKPQTRNLRLTFYLECSGDHVLILYDERTRASGRNKNEMLHKCRCVEQASLLVIDDAMRNSMHKMRVSIGMKEKWSARKRLKRADTSIARGRTSCIDTMPSQRDLEEALKDDNLTLTQRSRLLSLKRGASSLAVECTSCTDALLHVPWIQFTNLKVLQESGSVTGAARTDQQNNAQMRACVHVPNDVDLNLIVTQDRPL